MSAATKKLAGPVKLAYGLGLSAEGIKNNAFNVFLLFYYQQIVGLDPTLCGLALFVSLCVDAFADPAIGVWSDKWKSRLGRRHPFMYAAILPLSLCFLAVFIPPKGMSQAMEFLWLLVFSVGTRFAMALFVIPHQSLVPELTGDVDERTSLMSLRTVFAWMFGLFYGLLGYVVFLRATADYPQGLLNPAGYPPFARWGAVLMLGAMLVSALGTQRAALASQPDESLIAHVSVKDLPRAMLGAWKSPSYRAAVVAGLFLFVGYGIAENLNNYMNTFFWGFTSGEIGGFIGIIFLASLVVLGIARPLVARFGNRKVGIACAALMMVLNPGLVGLRLAGVLPKAGDPALFKILSVNVFVLYSAIILAMTVVGTMIADVTDEHEHVTGARQEGLLFSAAMFISKAASGVGVLASGFVIKLARFPENATPQTVDPAAVRSLGLWGAVAGIFFGVAMIRFFARFTLDRARHAGIVAELQARRQAAAAPSPAPSDPDPAGSRIAERPAAT